MNKRIVSTYWKTSSIKQKLITLGMLALLTIGAFGAIGEFSSGKEGGFFSSLAETVGLKEKSNNGDSLNESLAPPEGTLQLSKEYIYAGSRMLATEDYLPTSWTPQIANLDVRSATQIDVYWNQPPAGENVTSYNLRVNGTNVISNITYLSYPVIGLTPATTYTFEVQAVKSGGVSNWSPPQSATTSSSNNLCLEDMWTGGNSYLHPTPGWQVQANGDLLSPTANWWWAQSKTALSQIGDWVEFDFVSLSNPHIKTLDQSYYGYLGGQGYHTQAGYVGPPTSYSTGDKIKFQIEAGEVIKVYKNGSLDFTFPNPRDPNKPLYIVWGIYPSIPANTLLKRPTCGSGGGGGNPTPTPTPTPTPPPGNNVPNIWQGGTAVNAFNYTILANDDVIKPNGQGWWWIKSKVALSQEGDWAEFDYVPYSSPLIGTNDRSINYIYYHDWGFYTFNVQGGTAENNPVSFANGDKFKYQLAANNQVQVYKNGTLVYTFQLTRDPNKPLYIHWAQRVELPDGTTLKRPQFGGNGIIVN